VVRGQPLQSASPAVAVSWTVWGQAAALVVAGPHAR
jgi:hypothetical protein